MLPPLRTALGCLLVAVGLAAPITVHGEVPRYITTAVTPQTGGWVAQLKLSNPGAGTYGPALPALQLSAALETDRRVHFKLTSAQGPRYEIPQSLLPYPAVGGPDHPHAGQPGAYDEADPLYTVQPPVVGQQLSLSVTRTRDGAKLFEMGELEYSDQYLQLTSLLPERKNSDATGPHLYGLGEHLIDWQLPVNNHSFTMWDVDPAGTPADQNLYGSHPVYLQVLTQGASNGLAHLIFLRNSNGMDVITNPDNVQFRTVGGVLDFYVCIGPSPEEAVRQYHAIIGRAHLPPFWGLGWQQSRWGVGSIEELQGVVDSYAKAQIPLETIYSDIDYVRQQRQQQPPRSNNLTQKPVAMRRLACAASCSHTVCCVCSFLVAPCVCACVQMDASQDFTWNPDSYPVAKVQAFAQRVHANGQKYVCIVDAGIHNQTGREHKHKATKTRRRVRGVDATRLRPSQHSHW